MSKLKNDMRLIKKARTERRGDSSFVSELILSLMIAGFVLLGAGIAGAM